MYNVFTTSHVKQTTDRNVKRLSQLRFDSRKLSHVRFERSTKKMNMLIFSVCRIECELMSNRNVTTLFHAYCYLRMNARLSLDSLLVSVKRR
jgi:hypothetical protein